MPYKFNERGRDQVGVPAQTLEVAALLSNFGPPTVPLVHQGRFVDWKAKEDLFEQLRHEHEFGIGTIVSCKGGHFQSATIHRSRRRDSKEAMLRRVYCRRYGRRSFSRYVRNLVVVELLTCNGPVSGEDCRE